MLFIFLHKSVFCVFVVLSVNLRSRIACVGAVAVSGVLIQGKNHNDDNDYDYDNNPVVQVAMLLPSGVSQSDRAAASLRAEI